MSDCPKVRGMKRCPACAFGVPEEEIRCSSCGYFFREGEKEGCCGA